MSHSSLPNVCSFYCKWIQSDYQFDRITIHAPSFMYLNEWNYLGIMWSYYVLIPWGILRKFDDMKNVNITYWERIKIKKEKKRPKSIMSMNKI